MPSIEQQLHAAQQALAAAYDLRPMTPRQYTLLGCLAASGEMNQTQVVAVSGVDRSTVSQILQQLAKRGQVHRVRSRKDKRAFAVKISDAGRRALADARKKIQAVDRRLAKQLGSAEHRGLVSALDVLAQFK